MLKEDVPESVRLQARLMAQQELEALLAELNMTSADADNYGARLTAVQAHIAQLRNLLERPCFACVCPSCGTVLSACARRPVRPQGGARMGEAPDGRRTGRHAPHGGSHWRIGGVQASWDG